MKKLAFIMTLLFMIVLASCDSDQSIEFVVNEGIDTIELGSVWTDAGADFIIDGESFTPSTNGTVDSNSLGLYTITYTYTHSGTDYVALRYVIVTDQTIPILTLNIGIDTILVNGTWIDSGALVVDNSGEELTIIISGTVLEDTPGSYIITYTATDSSGNTNSIIRVVTVID